MPYTPTVWQDGVTPVNAVNLNKLENGLAAAVGIPADVVVTAPNFLIRNKLLVGDTQPAYRSLGDGKQEWGPGGSTTPDLNLYRVSAGVLRTDQQFVAAAGLQTYADLAAVNTTITGFHYVGSSAAAGAAYAYVARASGDTNNRLEIRNDGGHSWGDGASAPDVTLYRAFAGALYLQGMLGFVEASAGATALAALVTGDSAYRFTLGANGTMTWGPGNVAGDTNLYRVAADTLATDDKFIAGNDIYSRFGAASQVAMGALGPSAEASLAFGSAADTKLYRSAAGVLKTDGTIEAAVNVKASGNVLIGDLGGGLNGGILMGGDASLYRGASGVVKTGGALAVAGGIGTSFPGSPVDGQLFTLVDSLTAPTYAWDFRYVSGVSDANKWVYVGGSPAVSETSTDSTVGSATYVDPTSTVVSITVPRAGVYIIDYGYTVTGLNTADTFQWYGSPKIGAAATLDADAAGWFLGTSSGNAGGGSPSRWQRKTLAASDLIKMQYRGNGATSKTLDSQFLKITPVRCA